MLLKVHHACSLLVQWKQFELREALSQTGEVNDWSKLQSRANDACAGSLSIRLKRVCGNIPADVVIQSITAH